MSRGLFGLSSLLGLLGLAGAFQQPQQPIFRAGIQTVPIYATVRDPAGRLVGNLKVTDFQVLDNGKPVVITNFSDELVPITVTLLIDTSVSMTKDFTRVKTAATHFIDGLYATDRVRIGTFGMEVSLSPLLTSDKSVLKRILNEEMWLGGRTPMWRAMKQAIFSLQPEPGRRVVLLLSDGTDECQAPTAGTTIIPRPCSSEAEVRQLALDSNFMVYAIGMELTGLDAGIMRIADETGGGHFKLDRGANLDKTFETVADELHHQYLLGFTPAVLDGTVHTLEVKMTKKGLVAQARQSYMATR